ncbi:MAG: hypothetical protein SNJ74_08215 [Fimbriimonadaceae bacterium]
MPERLALDDFARFGDLSGVGQIADTEKVCFLLAPSLLVPGKVRLVLFMVGVLLVLLEVFVDLGRLFANLIGILFRSLQVGGGGHAKDQATNIDDVFVDFAGQDRSG